RALRAQRALRPELHRDPGGAHVRDDLRDRERVDAVGPALQQLRMAVLERLQTADARRDRSADPIRLARDVQARIALGQPRCGASSGRTSVRREWTYPGATTLARTLRLPTSRASDFVKPMIPAFEAP